MLSELGKIKSIGLIMVSLLFFQNCGRLQPENQSDVRLIDMASSVTASSVSFGSNNQHIHQKAFGSSPQAKDGRSIYNFDVNKNRMLKEDMWDNLRTQFNAIYLHSMLLVNNNDRYNGFPADHLASQVALNENQLRGLRYLQKNKGLKIIVDTGLGLGVGCNERRAWKFAANAVERDYSYIKRLHDAGVQVDEVSIDGPFLRVVEGSEKSFACESYYSNGFPPAKAAEIVSRYLGKLQRRISEHQDQVPKMNIVLNYPNLKVGRLHGFHDVNLEELMAHFAPRLEYPEINRIILDYPFNLVESAPHVFADKVQALRELITDLRGQTPQLGVIINTGASFSDLPMSASARVTNDSSLVGRYYNNVGNVDGYEWGKQCLHRGNRSPFILLYKNNECLNGSYGNWRKSIALQYIEAERKRYTKKSLEYYRLIKMNLPSGVEVDSVYFASWYEFPMTMSSYAANSVNTVKIFR